jgi:hypothetical protein
MKVQKAAEGKQNDFYKVEKNREPESCTLLTLFNFFF